jgi:hypothetical protein
MEFVSLSHLYLVLDKHFPVIFNFIIFAQYEGGGG